MCVSNGFTFIRDKILGELFEGNNTKFFEAIHAMADFEVDIAVVFHMKVLFVDAFLWNKYVMELEVMEILYGNDKVEVF